MQYALHSMHCAVDHPDFFRVPQPLDALSFQPGFDMMLLQQQEVTAHLTLIDTALEDIEKLIKQLNPSEPLTIPIVKDQDDEGQR